MIDGPPSRFKMFHDGAWRAVTGMYYGRQEVDNPLHARTVVLYCGPENWVTVWIDHSDVIVHRDDVQESDWEWL